MRYSQLLKYITPHRTTLLLVVVLLLAGTTANLANPLFAGKLTEALLGGAGKEMQPIGFILLAWLGLLVIRAVLSAVSSILVGNTGALMAAELRSRVYEHMQALPLTWFQERKQGDVLTLLSNDAETISRFVTNTVMQLLPQLATLVLAFGIVAWLDPVVALLAGLSLPAYAAVARLLGRGIRPASRAWIDSWTGLIAFVNENLSLMPALKAFTREPVEISRFAQRNKAVLQRSRKHVWLSSILPACVGLLAGAGALLLLWVAISHQQGGQLTAPELVMLLLYVLMLTAPLSSLAGLWGQVMHARGSAERLLEFFGEQREAVGSAHRELPHVKGRIEFENLCFTYPGREPVFENFSLSIGAGESVGLTGPNGAGKTTLVHLLLRFFDPSDGRIYIDGTDIRELSLSCLRRQIGLVAQNTLLLNGTVSENISYGVPFAKAVDIERAAEAAQISQWVQSLPDGYETLIGDQGVKLSGGQRQRLSLSRTLLRDPPIIILDEATAMFDPEAEARFFAQSDDLFGHRTVFLITHRLATLAIANRIIDLGQYTKTVKHVAAGSTKDDPGSIRK